MRGQESTKEARRAEARRDALRRIEAAVRRLEAGDYGYCERCGAPIPLARLEADPAAPLCLACVAAGGGRH